MGLGSWLAISLLLQDQAGAVRDTVVMIAAGRGFMETLAVTGQFVVSLVVLVLLGAVVFVLLALRCYTGGNIGPWRHLMSYIRERG